jgi:hypothetical protein
VYSDVLDVLHEQPHASRWRPQQIVMTTGTVACTVMAPPCTSLHSTILHCIHRSLSPTGHSLMHLQNPGSQGVASSSAIVIAVPNPPGGNATLSFTDAQMKSDIASVLGVPVSQIAALYREWRSKTLPACTLYKHVCCGADRPHPFYWCARDDVAAHHLSHLADMSVHPTLVIQNK